MSSKSSNVPALATNPKFIFFADFDGTITTSDTTVLLIDKYGLGRERRMELDRDVLNGRVNFRDAFEEMMNSVTLPFDECMQILADNIEIDIGFKDFYTWARENNVPIVILSSGIDLIIRALLDKFLGTGWDIQILSNSIQPREGKSVNEEGGWMTSFHDDSIYGHDKSIEIRKYSSLPNAPTLFYAGDGISDLTAAQETDLLFAKAGTNLVSYCERENVSFVPFRDWSSITRTCMDILSGKNTIQDFIKTSV